MDDKDLANPNIMSSFKVQLLLGEDLDPKFYANYEKYRDANKTKAKHYTVHGSRFYGAFTYEGYDFDLCTQDNHLKWLDTADTLKEAEMVEEFAHHLLTHLGFYDE